MKIDVALEIKIHTCMQKGWVKSYEKINKNLGNQAN